LIISLLDKKLPINGIAHITGGGVVDNLGRLLKINKLGAKLNNLFEPSIAMKNLLLFGKIAPDYAFRYLNMSNGMLLVVPAAEAGKMVSGINRKKGYQARNAGTIISENRIEIQHDQQSYIYTSFENK
jgi:phosphoribosylformylglycinamidine cyclo-ligase